LLATVTALALMVACVVGAYAHAAGHALPSAEDGTVVVGDGDHAGHHAPLSKTATAKPGHTGDAHDCDGTGYSHPDCCDTICHGGQAILGAAILVPHLTLNAPLMQLVDASDGAEPGGLDRPPKALPPA
jgi:hypothetical protein